ncbi:glycosyltransferase family 4 protein [Rhodopirellula sallentina]|uniref:Glycosyl transferase, group 1 family protein n=1 Tax=Rhodopirellula sallentina SM41 TaxID=1263870 RepID=M5TVV8_9BACT|nr:glycosyltransferase family 4 protein [Rhodopirellula sallentina]EMI53305.1 glycosyl transferase, group 1 family protein [Rhodopirellula sallentina SM41]
MKIGIIGHLKHPIAKPHAGGLESFTDAFVRRLVDKGHEVTLFASGDSDSSLPLAPIVESSTIPDSLRRLGRVHYEWVESVEDEAYEQLMNKLGQHSFDLIHNHSLSPIPLRFAGLIPTPMITTLHAPPLERMVGELQARGAFQCGRFVNISNANARAWSPHIPNQSVIHNGVDTRFWKRCGTDREKRAIWFGRILPDKGTHMAIDSAALAGLPIDLVGPISDDEYFQSAIVPKLGPNVRYLGHQRHDDLCRLIARSSVTFVTPCWDEPFGLVVVESLACGTPVACFERGAIPEIVDDSVGRIASPGDIAGLANAASQCLKLSSTRCRQVARQRFSFDHMIDCYEDMYLRPQAGVAA